MHVVCTAGHVDHGKSRLVKALTGMEPDRFAEEQRRGLTIDLGFAWTTLIPPGPDAGPPDRHAPTVAFVDLPGHERFVGNMLAGAGAVDLALFVVAADEGWMPQSQEHLDILDLLGVTRGLVAITKTDLVDDETVELAAELARESLAGSTFANVPVVPVSAHSGAGLDGLRRALSEVLRASPPSPDRRRPRLWVDRSFSVTGAGTVVTGTLAGGWLAVGDEMAVLPAGITARIRGLQSLQQPVERTAPGSRVAVNLSGVDRAAVRRGDALVRPRQWLDVTAFDAWARPLAGFELGRKGAWHVHAGSGEWTAQLWPLQRHAVASTGGFVRVQLDHPAPLAAGDRFVLREAGRRATVGGGVVLDPDPPVRARGTRSRQRRGHQLAERLDAVAAGDRGRLVSLQVGERGLAASERVAAAAGLHAAAAADAADAAGLVPVAGHWAHPAALAGWGEQALTAVTRHHRQHPVERAAPKDVAARALRAAGCPPVLVSAVVDALVARGTLAAEGPGVRAPSHRVELDAAQARARDALLTALGATPFGPPSLKQAAEQAAASPALVRELEAAGQLVRLGPDLAVVADALGAAHERLLAAYEREGPLTAARAKEILDTSRKYALPLLEELDRRALTRRQGDVRIILRHQT